jgi:branched-chain amino acid transport system substrate-binding protein
MKKFVTKIMVLLLIAAFTLAASGCGPAETSEPAAPSVSESDTEEVKVEVDEEPTREVFKLGVLGPFSGPAARTGEEFKGAVELAFDAIDYKIGPYDIELVYIDSQSDPAKATQAYEEAVIQKGIQAGLLNWHSSVAVAVMEVAAKHKIPHFFPMGATDVVNETWRSDPDHYFYWAMKGWATPSKLSGVYVQALEDAIARGIWEPEARTVSIWGEDTDWARSFCSGLHEQFQNAGWEIVSEDYFPIDQTDFVPLLTKINGLNPAVFAGTGSVAPIFAALIKQADDVGLKSVVIADGLGYVGEWYDLTGDSSNYALDQIPDWVTEEGLAFAADFEAKNGILPSVAPTGLCFDYANMFIEIAQVVIDEAGELTSETLADFALNKMQTGEYSFTGGIVMDEYKYTAETVPDPVVGDGYFIFPVLQYFDGEPTVVFPTDWADQDLQIKP